MGRIERVDSELQKELYTLINHELRDPRIDTIVTVMRVETASDLKHAKIYVMASGTSSEKELIAALNSAKAFLRKSLFDTLKIRAVPELNFILDNSMDNSFRISKLLKEIHKDDGENV